MIKVQATVQDKQAKLKELQDQFGNYVGDDEELADTKKVLTEAQTKLTQAQKNQADAQKDYDKAQVDYETKITQNKEAKEALAEFVTQEQEKKADNV